MPFNHHQGFLEDILQNPQDNTPRLIYSDFLKQNREDEHSLKLAEFIQVQIELEPYPVVPVIRCHMTSQEMPLSIQNKLVDGQNVGSLTFQVYVGFEGYSVRVGNIYDFDVSTSRVSGVKLRNFLVEDVSPGDNSSYREVTASRVPFHYDMYRYDHLLLEQHRLLVSGQSPLFHHIGFVCGYDTDGAPTGPDGRGGMTIWPANERYPSCEFSPRIRQWFRRGFVDSVATRLEEVVKYGREIYHMYPIQAVSQTNNFPFSITDANAPAFIRGKHVWMMDNSSSDCFKIIFPLIKSPHPTVVTDLGGDGESRRKLFDTRDEAVAAMNEACFAYARGE